jgi:23S rRNA pseudouridine2605 synthase
MMEERLQRVLSRAGVASRREAEVLIAEGRVTVDGVTVVQPGTKVNISKQAVKVDGETVTFQKARRYLLLNKPKGYMCTLKDPKKRPLVTELTRTDNKGLFPVGRLDFDTEGLLILTNDGDFAFSLTHPSKKVKKIYLVKVKGTPSFNIMKKLERGIYLEEGKTAPCRVSFFKKSDKNSWLQVVLYEGKNRQIKRMFAVVNHPVIKIKRVGLSFLNVGNLKTGEHRPLTAEEVKRLKELHGRS